MFDVGYSNQAEKFLKKADKILAKRLINKVDELKNTPIIHDTKIIN